LRAIILGSFGFQGRFPARAVDLHDDGSFWPKAYMLSRLKFWSKGYLFLRCLIQSGIMHRAQSRESSCWIFSADRRKWREQSRVVKIDQTAGSDGYIEEKPAMRPIILEVSSDRGDSIAIHADDLTLLIDAELKALRMSRADLQRCFAEGVKLMEGTTERDKVRPCANETADGEWIVTLVHYSALSDPLMQDRAQGKA
jgi:hypothetical protein